MPTNEDRPLTTALDHSEHAQSLVEECASELASVNQALSASLASAPVRAAAQETLQRSEAVESKVGEASEELSLVSRALEHEVVERQALERKLAVVTEQGAADRHSALHDALTGLPNRALFDDRLEHGLAQATRHHRALAVMFLDLDGFKLVNDTYGHEAGDMVLKTVATRLKEAVRGDDTLCRHGGDEFLYLLMEAPDETAVRLVAQKLVHAILSPIELTVGGRAIRQAVHASIGIAVFPRHGSTAAALIASADKAMYAAKKSRASFLMAM
jgi:diguanylate cyclase (GGDEF)-like protein